MARTFVTASNGARDSYSIPLALHERGLLERHVTDFYTPDWVPEAALAMEPRLKRRRVPNLPSSKTAYNFPTLLRYFRDPILKRKAVQTHFEMDRALSWQAERIARQNDAHLFMSSGSGFWAFDALRDRKRILYHFHPHTGATRHLLEGDVEKHPEVRHSFEVEYDSLPPAMLPEEHMTEWTLASHIVCPSHFCKKSLELQGCPSDRISVIPNGVDINADLEQGERNARCRFLFVGQGVQRKGLHHLLKAWSQAKLNDCDLTLVCYRIDPGILPLTEQPGVTLHAKMPYNELQSVFQQSDVFVMPSLIEGFGLVYLEAMAAGLFCIGTGNTGLPDMDPPDHIARVIDAGDEDALVEALTSAATDWKRGDRDRRASLDFVAPYSWKCVRSQFGDIAEEILSE